MSDRRGHRRRGDLARTLGAVALLVLGAGAVAILALALGLGQRDPLDLDELLGEARSDAESALAAATPGSDPFAWSSARREALEEGAALGSSHVVYALSPGGVSASAERTAAYRGEIEAAAARHGVDPDVLEAVIFLESAGRPDVSAGETPEAASGLAQIIPSTATDLLGMEVDLGRSIALTRRAVKAEAPERRERILVERARIDQRFDPELAIEGAATYLEIATERFGADDLAVESYHMGIGNLESVIRAYLGAGEETPIGELVAASDLSFAQIYFDSSPARHEEAYELLTGFSDDSSEYLWKVRASEEILRRFRTDREGLVETSRLATSKATLEEVFHPESETDVFEDADEIEYALSGGDLVPLPASAELGWVPDEDVGELAGKLEKDPALYRALRPEALATLTYLAGLVANESGERRPLRVTSAVRDLEYQEALTATNAEATREYSLHTTGWSFDVLRKYGSRAQATAFQYALDRLSSFALIDYAVEPGAIHVTVSGLGERLLSE